MTYPFHTISIPMTRQAGKEAVYKLVEDFEKNECQYMSKSFQEAEARSRFIDPFFTALGWELNQTDIAKKFWDVHREFSQRDNSTTKKPDYAFRIKEYKINFEPHHEESNVFEMDLLIYEQTADIIKPRIIIETKLSRVSTHDAIVYSYKAQNHKTITPFIRYGIIIGDREPYPLPRRLFRHGINFDFMMNFKKEELDNDERRVFIDLIEKELYYSKQIEEMIYNSRSKNRKHYFVLQKELHLLEMY
jgi:hypothetical protein